MRQSCKRFKGELFSKINTKSGYLPHFLKARHSLKNSKQKMRACLGCEYFKTERAGNSSCSYLSKKVVDILIWYWSLKIIHLYMFYSGARHFTQIDISPCNVSACDVSPQKTFLPIFCQNMQARHFYPRDISPHDISPHFAHLRNTLN